MKTRKQILMLLLVMLAGIPTLSAQTKKEKKASLTAYLTAEEAG